MINYKDWLKKLDPTDLEASPRILKLTFFADQMVDRILKFDTWMNKVVFKILVICLIGILICGFLLLLGKLFLSS